MSEFVDIPIEKLEIDPANIREKPNLYPLLIESVGEDIRQNLIVRPKPDSDKYLVTVGKRRFLSAKNAGRETLPCKIKEDLENDFYGAMAESILENVEREPIPKERWPDIILEFAEGMSIDPTEESGRRKIAEMTGMDVQTMQNYVKIAELPDWVREMTKDPEDRDLEEWQEALMKEPSSRSDSEKEALEEEGMSGDTSSIAEQSDVLSSQEQIQSVKLPIGIARELARSEAFEKMEDKSKVDALRTVLEGSKVGQRGLDDVINSAESRVAEDEAKVRKTPVDERRGSGVEKKVTVKLDRLDLEATERMMEEEGWKNLQDAVFMAFVSYIKQEGYYEQ